MGTRRRTSLTTYFSLSEGWNGSAWSKQQTPSPFHGAEVNGAAAFGPGYVVGVGTGFYAPFPHSRTFSMVWNGSFWISVLPIGLPSNSTHFIGAAAIPGTSDAWGVGYDEDPNTANPFQTIIERIHCQ